MAATVSTEQLEIQKEGVAPGVLTRAFHRLQERVRHPDHRRQLARLVAFGRPAAPTSETQADRDLAHDGVTFLRGYLAPDRAAQLRDLLSRFECQDPWKPERGLFRLEDAPAGTHVADIPAAPTLKALHDIAFDERLVEMAARYFGCRPYVDSIQAWWSLPGNSEPEEAENFHRDNDSVRFLKFFLYLTDVEDGDGPHNFVKGSHTDPKALDRRRLTNDEVEKAFGRERILSIKGRAGDAFMEDTFGVHKGQLPERGTRLLMQVRYSLTPSIFRSSVIVKGERPVVRREDSLLHVGG